MKKETAFGIFRAIISIALLALLFWLFRFNLPDVLKTLSRTNLRIFGLAILLMLFNFSLMALRLKVIFASQNVELKFLETNYLCFVGQFFNNFMPTSVGGDLVKAYYASKKSHSKVIAYASVFVDRLTGVASLVLWACAAAIFVGGFFQNKALTYILGAISLAMILFLLFLWHKEFAKKFGFLLILFKFLKLDEKIRKFYDAIQGFKEKRAALFKAFLLSMVLQFLSFYAAYLLAVSLNGQTRFLNFIIFMPIVGVLSMLPSINGLGIREGAFVYFFKQSMGAEAAFAVSLLLLLQYFILSLIGGFFYFAGHFKVYPALSATKGEPQQERAG